MSLFREAFLYASRAHEGQYRKGTQTPYISHPMAVASIVMENGGSEAAVIGALLHDVAEDQGGEAELANIKGRFGPSVAAIVRSLSDDLPEKGAPKAPWKERKTKYLAHLQEEKNLDAVLVCAADKLHNVRSIVIDYQVAGEDLWQRFNAPPQEIRWYYDSLVSALEVHQVPDRLMFELKQVVEELRRITENKPAQ